MIIKLTLALAACAGFFGVALGAFGAHGLRDKLTPAALATYQTAVQYQFIHGLALFGVALLMQRMGEKPLLISSATAFLFGILLFSGSLYWLALGGPRWLGPVTPLGGVGFLLGWALLMIAALRG